MFRPAIIDKYVFQEVIISVLFCFAVFLITGIIAGFLPSAKNHGSRRPGSDAHIVSDLD